MTAQDRTTLKEYFKNGSVPNENAYADLIDSFAIVGNTEIHGATHLSGGSDPIPWNLVSHGLLGGLTNDDHTQYVLANGTRHMTTLTVDNLATVGSLISNGDLTVGSNVLKVSASGARVGINRVADSQFDLDVNGNIRSGGFFVGRHALQLTGVNAIWHFDGSKPYSTNFSGDLIGNMGQVPTTYTGYTFRPGKFGKALQTSKATSNLVWNPSIEVDTSNIWGTAGTWTRYTLDSYMGVSCLKITGASSGQWIGFTTDSKSAGTTLSLQARVKGTIGATVWIGISDGSTYITNVGSKTFTGDWDYVFGTDLVPVGKNFNRVVFTFSDAGDHFIDNVQAEALPYCTPYADGSLGGGHVWVGTPNAGASWRPDTAIVYPTSKIIDIMKPGSISFWRKRLVNRTDSEYDRWFEIGSYSWPPTSDWWCILDNGNSTIVTFAIYSNGSAYGVEHYSNVPNDENFHHYVMTWDNANLRTYIDGILVTGPSAYFVPKSNPANFWISISAGLIDDLAILDHCISDSEVRAIYESNAPVFAETSTWTWRTSNTLAWADEFGLWAIDKNGNAAFGVSGVDGHSWGGGSPRDAGDVLIGYGSNYLFWDASAATMYVAGNGAGVTAINGANIVTGSITADKINVTNLSAIKTATGSLTVDGTLTVSTGNILAGAGNVKIDSSGLAINISQLTYLQGFNKLSYVDAVKAVEIANIGVVKNMSGYNLLYTLDTSLATTTGGGMAFYVQGPGPSSYSFDIFCTQLSGSSTTVNINSGTGMTVSSIITGQKGINISSSSFPASPSTGQLFFRSDLGLLCFWNGTYWLTVTEYSAEFARIQNISATTTYPSINLSEEFRPFITKICGNANTQTTLNSTNYWNISFRTLNQAYSVADVLWAPDLTPAGGWTIGVDRYFANGINRISSNNPAARLDIVVTKVGNPGVFSYEATIFYRFIIP